MVTQKTMEMQTVYLENHLNSTVNSEERDIAGKLLSSSEQKKAIVPESLQNGVTRELQNFVILFLM